MRVHYVSNATIPSAYANSIQVMKMCEALADAGCEVVLFGRQGGSDDPWTAYGVPAGRFDLELWRGRRRRFSLPAYLAWMRARRRRHPRPEVAYGRFPQGLVAGVARGVPRVLEVHQLPSNRKNLLAEWLLFRRRDFRGLVGISGALAGEYRRRLPARRRDIAVLTAPDGAPADPAGGAISREAASGARGPVRCLYAGSLFAGKGGDLLREVARELAATDGVVLRVVGGRGATDELVATFRRLPNVEYVGHVPHSEVGAHLAASHIALAPYQARVVTGSRASDLARWMSPLKIFEYMAAGLPMIVSDLPVIREVLRHEHNAILLPPDDVQAWCDAIRRLAASPERRRALGQTARRDFRDGYSWDARARRLVGWMEDELGVRPAASRSPSPGPAGGG